METEAAVIFIIPLPHFNINIRGCFKRTRRKRIPSDTIVAARQVALSRPCPCLPWALAPPKAVPKAATTSHLLGSTGLWLLQRAGSSSKTGVRRQCHHQGCLRAGRRPGHSYVHDRPCCLCSTAHCNNGKSSSSSSSTSASASGDRGSRNSSRCSGTGSRSSGSSTAGSEASSHKGGGKQQPDWNSMTQRELVNALVASRVIVSQRVVDAMLAVDRREFINPQVVDLAAAYQDRPQYNGEGQTISAPHMHAMCLEHLAQHLVSGARVLDVGSGSGYLTACMALMVGPQGRVVGVEKMKDLAVRSIRNIISACPHLAGSQQQQHQHQHSALSAEAGEMVGCGPNWVVYHGNVLASFLEGQEDFDAIHVGAAADEMPDELVRALNPRGRMVIPVGPQGSTQTLMVVDKDASGRARHSKVCSVNFVPLTRPVDDWQQMSVDFLVWLAAFVLDAGLVGRSTSALLALADLGNDVLNPVDTAAIVNRWVIAEHVAWAVLTPMMGFTGKWIAFVLQLAIGAQLLRMHLSREVLLVPSEALRQRKRFRAHHFVLLGTYAACFMLVTFKLIEAGLHSILSPAGRVATKKLFKAAVKTLHG